MKTILDLMKAKPSFVMMDYLAQYISGFDNKLTKRAPRVKILLVNREIYTYGQPAEDRYSAFLEKAKEFTKFLNKNLYWKNRVDSIYPHYPRFENYRYGGEMLLWSLSERVFKEWNKYNKEEK